MPRFRSLCHRAKPRLTYLHPRKRFSYPFSSAPVSPFLSLSFSLCRLNTCIISFPPRRVSKTFKVNGTGDLSLPTRRSEGGLCSPSMDNSTNWSAGSDPDNLYGNAAFSMWCQRLAIAREANRIDKFMTRYMRDSYYFIHLFEFNRKVSFFFCLIISRKKKVKFFEC